MKEAEVLTALTEIERRLDGIEDRMSFFVRAGDRFKKGQRVKFSAKADRRLITRKRHGQPLRGRVVEAGDSFL